MIKLGKYDIKNFIYLIMLSLSLNVTALFIKYDSIFEVIYPAIKAYVVSGMNILYSKDKTILQRVLTVSYTHLDVYKRQAIPSNLPIPFPSEDIAVISISYTLFFSVISKFP